MKRLLIIIAVIFCSCVNEVAIPVKATFDTEIVNDDYTVPVHVKISNNTEGADTFKWTFSGANTISSMSKNPGIVVYENPGKYPIRLVASNRDGSVDQKETFIVVKPALEVGFEKVIVENNFSPVTVRFNNTTLGATTYHWVFEGGIPAKSDKKNPEDIIFTKPGNHKVTLTVSNGEETYSKEENITVAPYLAAEFEVDVHFDDDDLQVPVTITTQNKSISATDYLWTVDNQKPSMYDKENVTITLTEPGLHTISLTASNGKVQKTVDKTIKVIKNTNLRVFNNVKLGINTAHKNNSVGAFFSTKNRKVYTKNEVDNSTSNSIDIVFFGLDKEFTFGKFVSPKDAQKYSFNQLLDSSNTIFVNRQENCECQDNLSLEDFDTMQNDVKLSQLMINESNDDFFNKEMIPRVVLFKTHDNRKGAIKIKKFVIEGLDSYLELDIKVQKKAN